MHNLQRIEKMYIYNQNNWPTFTWKIERFVDLLCEVRNLQGQLLGRMGAIGFELQNLAILDTLTLDVLKTNEIEGEIFDYDQVRSSVARKLGLDIAGLVYSDRHVDGMVDMMMDATQFYNQALTTERLFAWHAAMFPAGISGHYKIQIGNWRNDVAGPMQVVSGPFGKEKIHFEAPASSMIGAETSRFLEWFNEETSEDLVIKAAIAHIWFITIHPFDDGNGRITRALTDMILARSDKSSRRFYSMSAQIRIERNKYYEILEKTQKGNLDVSDWIIWFLNCLKNALKSSDFLLTKILEKANFWVLHTDKIINERQKKIVNMCLDDFKGHLTSSKYAKITKCSKDTAIRDINDLIEKNMLKKEIAGGRSTNYILNT